MVTLFIDFDNTLVESNKRVIEIINERCGTNKTEDDLNDYDYKSIGPISVAEKDAIFSSPEFFSGLEFKAGACETLCALEGKCEIAIATKGCEENLTRKEAWLKEHAPFSFKFIGMPLHDMSKRAVNMKGGFQVDDCVACLDTNADVRVLYKSGNSFPWQKGYEGSDILVANTWDEVASIFNFYLEYEPFTLQKRKGL